MYNTGAFVQPGGSKCLQTMLLPGFLLKAKNKKARTGNTPR
jgi:hypothetical protein